MVYKGGRCANDTLGSGTKDLPTMAPPLPEVLCALGLAGLQGLVSPAHLAAHRHSVSVSAWSHRGRLPLSIHTGIAVSREKEDLPASSGAFFSPRCTARLPLILVLMTLSAL